MEAENLDSRWEDALQLLFRPGLILQGAIEYALGWFFTRGWGGTLLLYSPILLILIAAGGLVCFGAAHKRETLVKRYAEWAEQELPNTFEALPEESSDDGLSDSPTSSEAIVSESNAEPPADAAKAAQETGSGSATPELSAYGELLLRRLLQLQHSRSAITYLVGLRLAEKGRVGQTRQMMRRIAPVGGGGYPPAHAWLAVDHMNRLQMSGQGISSKAELKRLRDDLAMAERWPDSPPGLMAVYADLLAQAQEPNEALAVLERSSSRGDSISSLLKLAHMASLYGQKNRFERAAESIKSQIRTRISSGEANKDDYAALANIFLLEQNPTEAREFVAKGLELSPQDPLLKRLLSETYRVEYLMNATATSVNLSLLDAAMKTDPTNPAVGTEVAKLIARGQQASDDLKAALEQQLASGHATALTHLLLANRLLTGGDLRGAIPHLELALRQAPGNAIVMNNLALVLARTDPQNIERALDLADRAVRAEPRNAELRDSLGEIRDRAGDKLGAIEAYEAAIGLDGTRTATRKKLAALYRELGMSDMAQVMEKSSAPPAN